MQRKFLEDMGLAKEVIDKILDENSAEIEKTRGDYDSLKAGLAGATGQLKAANDTIKELKTSNADNESLQKTITGHETTIKQLRDTHARELKGLKVDAAITKLLSENSAKYPELLSGKFDREKLTVGEDGTVSGLAEQLKGIRDTYGDMFGKTVSGRSPANPDGKAQGMTTFESLVNNADTMTAEEVAAQFAAMENK